MYFIIDEGIHCSLIFVFIILEYHTNFTQGHAALGKKQDPYFKITKDWREHQETETFNIITSSNIF